MKKTLSVAFISTAMFLSANTMANDHGHNSHNMSADSKFKDKNLLDQNLQTCSACHGKDGNSIAGMFPNLAGQNKPYIKKQLHQFKSGERVNATMQGIVMSPTMTEDAIDDLATFFAMQTIKTPSNASKEVALGKQIFHNGIKERDIPACMKCHGVTGEGNAGVALNENKPGSGIPSLKNQKAPYIVKQLKSFNTKQEEGATVRQNEAMSKVVDNMSKQEIEAVALYIEVADTLPDEGDIERGKLIFEGGIKEKGVPACMGCHGPTGLGNPGAGFPALRSQKVEYLEKQLKDFRMAGQNPSQDETPIGRYNDASSVMRSVTANLSDFDIKAVSLYIQQLNP